MTKQSPQYDLGEVCNIARKGNINIERRATVDSRNHGYFDEEIINCLEKLTTEHFHKSIPYEEHGRELVYDVYKITCPNETSEDIPLYIKIRLSAGGNWLMIGSFKPK